MIDLSISLVNTNNRNLLENCLKSVILNTKNINCEILLVDNGSKDNSTEMVKRKFPKVKVQANEKNLYFTKAHNQNLKKVRGKYFLLLNEDTILPPKTLTLMIDFMEKHPKVGLASCKEVDQKGKVDLTCSRFPTPLLEIFESNVAFKFIKNYLKLAFAKKSIDEFRYKGWLRNSIKTVDVIPGSFMLGKTAVLNKIGFLDEHLIHFYQESDYCKRAKEADFLSCHVGTVQITHLKAQANNKIPTFTRYQLTEHDMLHLYQKYFGKIWYLILWLLYRPNWLYWKLLSEQELKHLNKTSS